MLKVHYLLLFIWISQACTPEKEQNIKHTVQEFYETYALRQNITKFLGFYADDAALKDIIHGDHVLGKDALKRFFDWENTAYQPISEKSLVVHEIIVDGEKAVVKGHFTKFQWGETRFGPMHFTTLLTLNPSGKIIQQVDWINYPTSLVDYSKRKDSNSWIQ